MLHTHLQDNIVWSALTQFYVRTILTSLDLESASPFKTRQMNENFYREAGKERQKLIHKFIVVSYVGTYKTLIKQYNNHKVR